MNETLLFSEAPRFVVEEGVGSVLAWFTHRVPKFLK